MVSKPCRCENILELIEWFDMSNRYVLILDWPSPCLDVHEFCQRHKGRLSEPLAREIMRQVVQAARHCCGCGVLHGDIKAENLLINTNTMDVKLKNFSCGALLKDTPYTRYAGMCIVGNDSNAKKHFSGHFSWCSLSFFFSTQAPGHSVLLSGYVRGSIWDILPQYGVWVYSCLTWYAETCPYITRVTTFIRTCAWLLICLEVGKCRNITFEKYVLQNKCIVFKVFTFLLFPNVKIVS